MKNLTLSSGLVAALFLVLVPGASLAQPSQMTQPAGAETWPRTRESAQGMLTIYQPEIDEWDGYKLTAHAACSVRAPASEQPIFGVIQFTAHTHVDRQARTVALENVRVDKATFPSEPEEAAEYRAAFQDMVPKTASTVALDRVEAALAIESASRKAREHPVKNEPPAIIFSKTAAVLVLIDGTPSWRTVEGTSLERVLNTRALVLRDPSGRTFVHLFDGWMEAPGLGGPWGVATTIPSGADRAAQDLDAAGVVDLMVGPPDEKDPQKRPSLRNGAPRLIVADRPTEVIVMEGEPNWAAIPGTNLLYMTNTTGNVFIDTEDQKTYVLVSGRWFRSPSLDGPWAFVPVKELPAGFARIPDDSPKENAKASVPGTPQAQEALIANEIPQTAKVERQKAAFTPQIAGAPELKPIEETPLFYVANSPTPIIEVSPSEWYAVVDGVWFTAPAVGGPWVVASSVPPVIYSIPPSSPLHNVIYVRIYDAEPSYVVVGYTPGYLGTVVAPGPVVVYGTGYWYAPYIGPAVWFGWPFTYGFGIDVAWTPWTGWGFGFGFGWGWGAVPVGWGRGWCWAPAPWWGPLRWAPYDRGHRTIPAPRPRRGAVTWGPRGWAATSGNVYRRWGAPVAVTRTATRNNAWTGMAWSGQVAHAYNSRTGTIAAGQRAPIQTVYGGPGARGAQRGAVAPAGRQYFGARDGSVYRYEPRTRNFQQYNRDGSWGGVQSPARVQSLQQQHQARQMGEQRAARARSFPAPAPPPRAVGGIRGGGGGRRR